MPRSTNLAFRMLITLTHAVVKIKYAQSIVGQMPIEWLIEVRLYSSLLRRYATGVVNLT